MKLFTEILPDNEIRFTDVFNTTIAVAGLVFFEPEDHARMDVLSNNGRIKCPKGMLPTATTIWAVTTTSAGCFWAYDLNDVSRYLNEHSDSCAVKVSP